MDITTAVVIVVCFIALCCIFEIYARMHFEYHAKLTPEERESIRKHRRIMDGLDE